MGHCFLTIWLSFLIYSFLFDCRLDDYNLSKDVLSVSLDSDGAVFAHLYNPTVETSCSITLKQFPQDQHNCTLRLFTLSEMGAPVQRVKMIYAGTYMGTTDDNTDIGNSEFDVTFFHGEVSILLCHYVCLELNCMYHVIKLSADHRCIML